MTSLVTVAVFIDRGEAIIAGRNKWGWQNTELDLDVLDAHLREALSRCPEKDGALQITHADSRPGSEKDDIWRSIDGVRDNFELEREGMPSIVEAVPSTALQMLEHLASLPRRLRARGADLLSSAQVQAATRAAQAMGQTVAYLKDLDDWLATAPGQLVTEQVELGNSSDRFQRVDKPRPPTLATIQDEQIAYDLEEAYRLLDGKVPRNGRKRPGCGRDHLGFASPPSTLPLEHLGDAASVLEEGTQARMKAIAQHRQAIAAMAQDHFRIFQEAQQMQLQEERRLAAIEERKALLARKSAARNQALREWATVCGKRDLLALLDRDASADEIADALRLTLFAPLAHFSVFRKIRKQDLLIANPNLGDFASGLEAEFDDVTDNFTDPSHQATAKAIAHASFEANIPAQFVPRLHHGYLIKRGDKIGMALEARSLLVTAHFGHLKISRAFAIGNLSPVKS